MTLDEIRRQLYLARVKQGISQVRLGSEIGTVAAQISHLENGQRNGSVPLLIRWAEALGYRIELVRDE